MKKLLFVLLALIIATGAAYAANDSYSKPGSLTAQVGLGLYWAGFGADLQGGVDYSLYRIPSFPLDLGVSGRVGLGFGSGFDLGAYGTAHFSWKDLGTRLDWLNHLETYIGLGLLVLPDLRFDGYVGTAYHINSQWAVYLEGAYENTVLGASYRF